MVSWNGASIAGTISGTFSPVATGSNVDLTIAGKSDWVHWGLYTPSSIDRKWGVAAQISDYSLVGSRGGFVEAYQYSDNYNSYTWHDGWQTEAETNTTTGVWAYQAYPLILAGAGFQITAPADTTNRLLQVFVGAFAARGQFTATLSDGGTAYSDTSLYNPANGPGGVYSLDYRANSPNQTLTVQWILSQRAPGSNTPTANVTLQGAALTVTNADNPPFAILTSPGNASAFAGPATVPISADVEDYDGTVTNVDFMNGISKIGAKASSPYDFSWSSAPIGHYFMTARATDNGGASRTSPPSEVFVYGTGGSLSGSVAQPPAQVDLTQEGTNDWIHLGYGTNSSFDRKSGVVAQINYALQSTVSSQQFSDNYTGFSWSDGTPTATASNSTTGVFVTGQTNGFSVRVPADQDARTLRVYVGCYGAQAIFEAYLSDLSAAPFVDRSLANQFDNSYGIYEINYASATAGQELVVNFRSEQLYDIAYGNVTFQAATLSGGPPPLTPVQIFGERMAGADFVMSFLTQTNHTYAVEYTPVLPNTNWATLTNISGTGGEVTVTDSKPAASQRYYRVRVQ